MLKKFKKLSKTNKSGVILALFGIVGWTLAGIVMLFFEVIFKQPTTINLVHFVIVPVSLVLTSVVMNYFEIHKKIRIHPNYVTIVLTGLHGIWGLFVGLQVNEAYNGFLVLFLFSFGLLYLKISFGLIGTLVFSLTNLLMAAVFFMILDIQFGTDDAVFVIFFVFYGVSSAFINEFDRRKSLHLKHEISQRKHSYDQLQKILFPHQIQKITAGAGVESTLPVEQGLGSCLIFEVIDSSKIKHERVQEYFRLIFGQFSDLLQEGYDSKNQISTAFRIVELNSKFVCTVGFPFRCPDHQRPSRVALTLAQRFIHIFYENITKLDYPKPIHCAVTIASGELEGFFTKGFPIEYHLHGDALTKAETMNEIRKMVQGSLGLQSSIVMIQDRVFNSLTSIERQDFIPIEMDDRIRLMAGSLATHRLYYLRVAQIERAAA